MPPGSNVSREESQNSTGGMDITVMIDKIAAGKMAQPGSESNRQLNTMGARTALARR